MHRRSEDEKESPVSAIAGAILGLAAFMLAFTFAIVSERHDTKRALVREDAIAIRTAWQRSDFLPEDGSRRGRCLAAAIRRCAREIRGGGQPRPERVKTFLSETQRMQDRLWNMAVANARKDMNSDVAALYIDSLNEVNGIHASRVAVGIQARVPERDLARALLHHDSRHGERGLSDGNRGIEAVHRAADHGCALSFALVFALIAALDRPDSGILKVTQQPLIDLHDSMAAAPERAQ